MLRVTNQILTEVEIDTEAAWEEDIKHKIEVENLFIPKQDSQVLRTLPLTRKKILSKGSKKEHQNWIRI